MPKKRTLLKPSGYDIVIRNRDRIHDINARLGSRTRRGPRQPLIDEKDRLIHEMWAACPHEDVAHVEVIMTAKGQRRMRFCTSCGLDEDQHPNGRFAVLKRRPGRKFKRFGAEAFTDRLRETIRWTGINL